MAHQILIVDDSATVRQQLGLALTQSGFEVADAFDGLDAIAKISAEIALMICDVNMPRMGGLELVEKFHADPRWSSLPVVMLTTEATPALMVRAKAAGAKAWMVKPFKAELLVAAAKRFARR